MGVKDSARTVTYYAYNVANGAYQTGDNGNHTLRLQSDGALSTPSNSSAEVDAANMPGAYELAVTAGENDGLDMTLCGVSSTADVIIIPLRWSNEVDAGNVAAIVAAVWAASTRTLTSFGTLVADIWAGITTAAREAIADTVFEELLSGHTTPGSAGAALSTAGSAADPLTNTVPGSYSSGTAGHALGRIGSGQIVTTSTTTLAGDIQEIVGGADYLAAIGSAIDWTDVTGAAWADLTGATVVWRGTYPGAAATEERSMSVVTPDGAGAKVRLELTGAQSEALEDLYVGQWSFEVWATLAAGAGKQRLAAGTVPVCAGDEPT